MYHLICIEHQGDGSADELNPAHVIAVPQADCEICHPLAVVR